MSVNHTIRRLRIKAKLTQAQLAERSGVGLRFAKELERGKPTVRLDKVNQVLEFFGYHLEAVKNSKTPDQ